MDVLLAGGASFVFIFLKAFQQRNVVLDAPWHIVVVTSLAMASVELYVIAAVVYSGYSINLVASVGLGAGLGAVAAMRLHRRIFRQERS